MSINEINLPEEKELEQLANNLFKSQSPNADATSLPAVETLADLEKISPNLVNKEHVGYGRTPVSVAGSGVQPSYKNVNHPSDFDVEHPQTSLPDPHFYNGEIPASVAGSGVSPSQKSASTIKDNDDDIHSNHFFEETLKNSLGKTNIPYGSASLPLVGDIRPQQAEYYFLNYNNPLPYSDYFLKDKNDYSGITHGITNYVKPPFDVGLIKADFPILKEYVNGKPLVWLDNAATTQKPNQVIERVNYFYEHENSNIHRAAHELAARATDAYEAARDKVKTFLNAGSANEIVFVRGTTEAINLVAQSWGDQYLNEGDEIILSNLEHHANIVPWQLLAAKKGLKIRVIPVDDDGQLILSEYEKLFTSKTKLVSFTQVSNALGTVTPAKQIIDTAHAHGATVLLDGAQSVSHLRVDLQSLNPDFFVFSGHKIFGPTGIGVLYGKEEILNSMQPWQGGGNMIKDVTFEHTEYHNAPGRFEAGTGNIADAVGLGAALDYVNKIGINLINQYEHGLLLYAMNLMKQVPGLRLIGTAADKASVLSFTLEGFTNDEVGQALNKEGIAVRTGHHCAQPILRRFGVESTVRPSLAFYNTCADVDLLVSVLHRLKSSQKRNYFL